MPSANLQSPAMQEVRERLETFVAPFQKGGPPTELEVLRGKPFIKIIRAALQRLACSVLTVKPDGFVSPVRLD